MKVLLVTIALVLAGCSPYKSLMDKVPLASFDKFEYHRAGNMTSMDITVLNAVKVGPMFEAESIDIKGDYGPFVNFNMTLEGYKREVAEPEQLNTQGE